MKADQTTIDADELYALANLYPRATGLYPHATIDDVAVAAVRPLPRVVAGRLSSDDQRAAAAWIALHADTLVAYWDGDSDTMQLAQALVPLAS